MSYPRLYKESAKIIGREFRTTLYEQSNVYPWHYWIRLVYNDALTFTPGSAQGGIRANWLYSDHARAPHNRAL